jgi:hypothetical protein
MLNDKDLARLTNNLQAPVIVQDILDGSEILSGDVQYGLHEILSEYQPDSALLCIALAAHKIASAYKEISPNMGMLKMECELIVADYAGLWIDHSQARSIDHAVLMETLVDIPDDLESLAALLEGNMAFLESHNAEAAGLCEILIVQARAHALIAETFIEAIEGDNESTASAVPHYTDNVIPFPYYARG